MENLKHVTSAEDFSESIDNDQDEDKNIFIRHCEEALGADIYEIIVEICQQSKDGDVDILTSQFEALAGKEMVDTCFLVYELVAKEKE